MRKTQAIKTIFASMLSMLALNFASVVISDGAYAQNPAPHSKSSGAIGAVEKKPDGSWESLKPEQQAILAPLESDWDYLQMERRKKWTQVANLYPKMSAQEQERLRTRMASWANLSQRDRRIARENYLSSLKFPAEKKSEAWQAYQQLTDEQKQKLAAAENSKKKPTAANAPTLQQHPVSKQPTTGL